MINININMIAERRARRIREMATLRITSLVVICVTVLLVLWNAINLKDAYTAKHSLVVVHGELDRQKPRFAQWNDVQLQIKAKRPVVALLKQVQNSECAWMTVFGDLSRITPPGVVLASQQASGTDKGMHLHLTGRVTDEQTLASFMLAFSQQTTWAGQPTMKTFSAGTVDANGRPQYSFDLEIPIRGLVGGEL